MGKILIEARYWSPLSYFHQLAKAMRSGTIGSVEVSEALDSEKQEFLPQVTGNGTAARGY
jgi:hypothetical protein